MIRPLCLVLLSFLTTGLLVAGDSPGLKVGENAPEFTLVSASGEAVSLTELLDNGPVVLAFVRSADWCPFCRRQLQDLEKSRSAIEATGAQLVALSYDAVETQAQAMQKLGLTYPLLSDPGSLTIKAYDLLNEEAKGRAMGVPHPAIFIIDSAGTIRVKLMEESYRDRPASAEIIKGIQSL